MAFLDAPLSLPPVLGQSCARVGKVVFRVCGNHHEYPIRPNALLSQFDSAIHRTFPNRHGTENKFIIMDPSLAASLLKAVAPEMRQDFLSIPELRYG
jgi:hypothetical protein